MADNWAEGLDPAFAAAIQQIIDASNGTIWVASGHRSTEDQQRLWDAALAKYGDEETADNWVARPGHSNHELGFAVDLRGDLDLASQLAVNYGLHRPMSWEPWHFEPVNHESDSAAYTTPPPGASPPQVDRHDIGVQLAAFMGVVSGGAPNGLNGPAAAKAMMATPSPAEFDTTATELESADADG